MAVALPHRLDGLGDLLGHVAALEVVVDVVVPQAQLVLVGPPLVLVEEVGGGHLVPQLFGRTEVSQQRAPLPLVQARQREDVGGAVAELGEEARDVLGGVVGADHEQPAVPGEGVLGDHAVAGLGVALGEVRQLCAGGPGDLAVERIDAGRHVDGDGLVGVDELHGRDGVGLVVLHAVGQAHPDEHRVPALRADPLHRELGQTTGQCRVHPAGQSQHVPFGAARPQVVHEEPHPTVDLGGRVDLGLHPEVVDDRPLKFTHGPIVWMRRGGAPPEAGRALPVDERGWIVAR